MSSFASPAAASASALSPSSSARPSAPSFDLANCAAGDTIKLVSGYLERLTVANDAVTKGDLTRFHARTVPTIDILAYLQRILKYAPCGNEVFLAVLVYFDRISRRANGLLDAAEAAASQSVPGSPQPSQAPLVSNPMSPSLITHGMDRFHPFGNQDYDRRPMEGVDPPSYSLGKPDADTSAPQDPGEEFEFTMSKKRKRKVLIINSYNVHRLLITGVMVASKLFSDVFFLNSHYAKVGGLPVMELNQLELEFLIFNDFNLHVTLEELQRTGDALMAHATELYPRSVVNERGMLLRELSPKAVPQPRHYRDDSGSPGGLGGSGGGNGASFQPSVTAMSGQSQYNGPNASGPSANYDGRQAFFGQQASPPYDRDGMPSRSHSAAAPLQPHPPIHVQPDPSAGAYPPSPAASDETKTQHGSRKGSTDPFEARRPLYGSPQSPVRMEGVETVFPANAALGTGMATDYDTPMHFGTPPGSVVTG